MLYWTRVSGTKLGNCLHFHHIWRKFNQSHSRSNIWNASLFLLFLVFTVADFDVWVWSNEWKGNKQSRERRWSAQCLLVIYFCFRAAMKELTHVCTFTLSLSLKLSTIYEFVFDFNKQVVVSWNYSTETKFSPWFLLWHV